MKFLFVLTKLGAVVVREYAIKRFANCAALATILLTALIANIWS